MNDNKGGPKGSGSEYPDHPRVAVGAVVFKDESVLMVLRSKPPSKGVWAIPGGSVELGETIGEAAEREIFEETGVVIKAGKPVYVFDSLVRDSAGSVQFHYVIIDLLGEYVKGDPTPSDDALDAKWISAEDMKELPISRTTSRFLKEKFGFGE